MFHFENKIAFILFFLNNRFIFSKDFLCTLIAIALGWRTKIDQTPDVLNDANRVDKGAERKQAMLRGVSWRFYSQCEPALVFVMRSKAN